MKKIFFIFLLLFLLNSAFSLHMKVFGVRDDEQGYVGVVADLEVYSKEGSGHVFIDTTPLTEVDTQTSARLSKEVACTLSEKRCSDKDFFYIIKGNFPMIGGPSAGAAMAVLTLADLMGIDINSNVSITGTINPDGSIGSVGGVREKVLVAQENGITTFLIPKGQYSELANLSFNNGFRVVEVSTLSEAFYYFTNYSFPQHNDTIYFDRFEDAMKPMCDELMDYGMSIYEGVENKVKGLNLSSEDMDAVNYLLNSTKELRTRMIDAYGNGSYYSAASYAVGLSINSFYINYLTDYLVSNSTEYVVGLSDSFSKELSYMYDVINRNFTIDNINDIEAINTAIDRYFEAEDSYSTAIDEINNGSYYSALYDLAYAKVRLKTAETWLTLLNRFNGDMRIVYNQDEFKDLAMRRIEDARSRLSYAYSLGNSYYIDNSVDHLNKAERAYAESNYVYSIFESLESLSNSNLAIQLFAIDEDQLEERIKLSKEQAMVNINSVQSKGITPILALSYFEYANSFENYEPVQSIIFLEYSKQFSILSYQMVNELDLLEEESSLAGEIVGAVLVLSTVVVLFYLYKIVRVHLR